MTIMHDSDRAWKKFGETNPYWAVYTAPEFRDEKLNEEARAQFFRTGEDHIRVVLEIVRRQLDSEFKPQSALDFGSGVGRLVIPLAEQCENVVGIDVSPAMTNLARQNCAERGLSNVTFFESLEQIQPNSSKFDFVHTYNVLQHIPVLRGMSIISGMVDCVVDGGVGVLHMTYLRQVSSLKKAINWFRRSVPFAHNIFNLAQGYSFSQPLMQMNNYPLNDVFHLLQQKNCHNIVVRYTDHNNYLGVVLMFKKEKRADID